MNELTDVEQGSLQAAEGGGEGGEGGVKSFL
jgi:hypothetical protein